MSRQFSYYVKRAGLYCEPVFLGKGHKGPPVRGGGEPRFQKAPQKQNSMNEQG